MEEIKIRKIDQNFEGSFDLTIMESYDSRSGVNRVLECTQFKDSNNLSDEKWTELRSFLQELGFNGLSSLYRIKKEIALLNEQSLIKQNNYGVFNDVLQKLKLDLSQIVKRLEIPNDVPLRLKFCADGAYINKTTNVLNFGFSCINDFEYCKGAKGHSMLGIFEIEKENNVCLSLCLKELFVEIEQLERIDLNDSTYFVKKYLGGDLKFLAAFMGIKSATSNYPCVFCKAHQNEFGDLQKEFSAIDTTRKARTIADSHNVLKSNVKNTLGYISAPISPIPFTHVIPDVLHLFLRICEKLIKLLIDEIQSEEGYLFVYLFNQNRK